MRIQKSRISVIALAIFAMSCGSHAAPGVHPGVSVPASVNNEVATSELPAWIAEPRVLPPGLEGTNNCTFPFGNTSVQWDFHPEGACWEHPAQDGWTRNQQHRVHASSVPLCGGAPGDVFPIRMCRAGGAGQPGPSPACETATTGPNGCVICVRSVVCH